MTIVCVMICENSCLKLSTFIDKKDEYHDYAYVYFIKECK